MKKKNKILVIEHAKTNFQHQILSLLQKLVYILKDDRRLKIQKYTDNNVHNCHIKIKSCRLQQTSVVYMCVFRVALDVTEYVNWFETSRMTAHCTYIHTLDEVHLTDTQMYVFRCLYVC